MVVGLRGAGCGAFKRYCERRIHRTRCKADRGDTEMKVEKGLHKHDSAVSALGGGEMERQSINQKNTGLVRILKVMYSKRVH